MRLPFYELFSFNHYCLSSVSFLLEQVVFELVTLARKDLVFNQTRIP